MQNKRTSKVNEEENFSDDIVKIRQQIQQKRQRSLEIDRLPLPTSDLAEKLHKILAEKSKGFLKSVFHSVKHGYLIQPPPIPRPGGELDLQTIEEVFAFCFSETIEKKFLQALEKSNEGIEQIPEKNRKQMIALLRDEIRALEIAEERACETAEKSGFKVDRRGDLDPAVYLGLA